MAVIMTKRGQQDNIITYEHICDTAADMALIEPRYKTLGSVCIVIQGESGGMEVYMANSSKEWSSIADINASNSDLPGLGILLGTADEETGLPDVDEPLESTLYLIADGNEDNNLYKEYVYVEGEWELIGAAKIDLSEYAKLVDIPTDVSALTNDAGYLTSFTETDPTVPTWAKAAQKPSYTAAEVGALPDDTDLSIYAPKANPVFTGSISLGRKADTTVGFNSVAEGSEVTASGTQSHAEGSDTAATNSHTHAEGYLTTASGTQSHAEGANTVASGAHAHAEGLQTEASGAHSHAEGCGGTYTSKGETLQYKAAGTADHIEGYHTRTENATPGNHAEGNTTAATGGAAHSEGYNTTASGQYSHAEGSYSTASGSSSHAEGGGTTASGWWSHAEGGDAVASGTTSHAEGQTTLASGSYSHAEGLGGTYTTNGTTYTSEAAGMADHVEGYMSRTANRQPGNHAEGYMTSAIGGAAHSEGSQSIASGAISHAEGYSSTASGQIAHAEGNSTAARGDYSHTEGYQTVAVGTVEHVSGQYNVSDSAPEWVASTSYVVGDIVSITDNDIVTIYKCKTANSDAQFSSAKWDKWGQYLVVVGNGTASARSNAYALDWQGNEHLAGDLYLNCNADSTGGVAVGARIAALEAEIASLRAALESLLVSPSSAQTETGDTLTDESNNPIEFETPGE